MTNCKISLNRRPHCSNESAKDHGFNSPLIPEHTPYLFTNAKITQQQQMPLNRVLTNYWCSHMDDAGFL